MKKYLALFCASVCALSLTGCAGRLFVEDESLSDTSSAESAADAVDDTTEDSAEPTTEPTTEAPTELTTGAPTEAPTAPPITVDSAFLEGEWVDEHGFLLCYQDGVMREYMDFSGYEITVENGVLLHQGEPSDVQVNAVDETTIRITIKGEEPVTAVRLESEQGQAYLAAVKKQLAGEWMTGEDGVVGCYTFTESEWMIGSAEELNAAEPFHFVWEGARLYMTEMNDFNAVRIEGDRMTLLYEGGNTVMYRKGSEATGQLNNADSELTGEWENRQNPNEIWRFDADGTLEVNGERCSFTAVYENYNIKLTLEDGTCYTVIVSDRYLTLLQDQTALMLWRTDN